MGKIKTPQTVSNVKTLEDLIKYSSQIHSDTVSAINGGIDLVDNASTSLVTANITAANQEFPVPHTLRRVPSGYNVVSRSENAIIFDGKTASNKTTIYIQASAPVIVKLLVF